MPVPLIVDTLARLRSCSCIIDGEAVACDDNGVPRSISSVTTALTTAYSFMRYIVELELPQLDIEKVTVISDEMCARL